MDEIQATYKGELQFKTFSDGSRSGPCVTFRLPDRDDLDKFTGLEGRRFACMLVLLNDQEEPEAPPAAAKTKAATLPATRTKRERMPPLLDWTVKRCDEDSFQQWCIDLWDAGETREIMVLDPDNSSRAAFAKEVILKLCGIESRKELDADERAAKRFHERVREPYAAWLQLQQGVPA